MIKNDYFRCLFGGLFVCFGFCRYASLFFIACVDANENALLVLEVVHHYVEVLDKYFGNVCELDLIFNFHKVSASKRAFRAACTPQGAACTPQAAACTPQLPVHLRLCASFYLKQMSRNDFIFCFAAFNACDWLSAAFFFCCMQHFIFPHAALILCCMQH